MKFPKAAGACADLLFKMKEERRKAETKIDAMKALESALEDHLIQTLPKAEASGIAGKLASVKITISPVPTVDAEKGGWEEVYGYVAKSKNFQIFQRRLSNEAVKELWEQGVKIPGVTSFNKVKVSLTKLK